MRIVLGAWALLGVGLGVGVGLGIVWVERKLRARLPILVLGLTLTIGATGFLWHLAATASGFADGIPQMVFLIWLVFLGVLAAVGVFQTVKGRAWWWTNAAGLISQIGAALSLVWLALELREVLWRNAVAGATGMNSSGMWIIENFGPSVSLGIALALLASAFRPTR